MVTYRLSQFSYIISFLLANSACWPISFFLPANSTCWPFSVQPDGCHRLLLLAFPHAREILLEVLAINSNRKLDAVQLLKHVCIPMQNLINLVRSVPSWRPLAILFVFSSQWQYCLPNQVSNLKILWLDLLVVRTSNFSLIFLDLLQRPKLSSVRSSTLSFIKAAYCLADRSF